MGKVVEKTLEILQEKAEITQDLIDIVLAGKTGYIGEARRSFLYGPKKFKTNWAEAYRRRQSFYSLLNQLKRDGLIKKKETDESSIWSITLKGMKRLSILKHAKGQEILPKKHYPKGFKKELVIVSFDVPERERKKRDWLRSNLMALDFQKLQKSVWMGTSGLPQEFVEDLRTYGLIPYVHILSVNRRGTIVSGT